jgi:uncharacterized GH25 family protein
MEEWSLFAKRSEEELRGYLETKARVLSFPTARSPRRCRVGPDGAFSLPVPTDVHRLCIGVESRFGVHTADARWFTLEEATETGEVLLELEPAGEIEGSVLGPGGALVRTPWILALPSVGKPGSLPKGKVGDEEGRFVLAGLRPGVYDVAAVVDGLGPGAVETIAVRAWKTTPVEIVLTRESYVSGRVEFPGGQPVPQARVEHSLETSDASRAARCLCRVLPVLPGSTDSKGRFRLGPLPPGRCEISVSAPGLFRPLTRVLEVPVGGSVEDLVLVCEEGASISGRVVDEAGEPVAGAEVLVDVHRRNTPASRRHLPQDSPSATSDERGRFRIAGLEDGKYDVWAWGGGYGTSEPVATRGGDAGIEIVVPRLSKLSGTVRAADTGEPVPRFWVYGDAGPHGEGRDGRFEVANVGAGQVRLEFEAAGFVREEVGPIEVRPGQSIGDLDVRLERGATIRGKVLEKGSRTPIEGAVVQVTRPKNATTDSAGSFELVDLRGEPTRLFASHPEYIASESDLIEVKPGEVVEGVILFLSRGGTVDGYAVDENGLAMKRGSVRVYGVGEARRWAKSVEIDASGYSRAPALPPGRYRVVARPPRGEGRSTPEETVEVRDGIVTRVYLSGVPR